MWHGNQQKQVIPEQWSESMGRETQTHLAQRIQQRKPVGQDDKGGQGPQEG